MTSAISQNQLNTILSNANTIADIKSNQIIIEKHSHGKTTIIQTYVDDEFILYSFLFQLITVYSFYPIIYLFEK